MPSPLNDLRERGARLLDEWQLPKLPDAPQLPKLPSMMAFRERLSGDGARGRVDDDADAASFVRDATSDDEAWVLKAERDGVRVWQRRVPGSPYDEIRGNGLVHASPQQVLDLLRRSDEETIRLYNPMYASGHDLQQLDKDTKVSYGAVRSIFPFQPRDTVTRIADRELAPNALAPAGGRALILRAVTHPDMPPRDGFTRAKIIRGMHLVQPVVVGGGGGAPPELKGGADGWTNFTFTQQVNAGGVLPAWLINTLVAQDAVVFVKRVGEAARTVDRRAPAARKRARPPPPPPREPVERLRGGGSGGRVVDDDRPRPAGALAAASSPRPSPERRVHGWCEHA